VFLLFLKLFEDPVSIPVCEGPGFLDGTNSGNSCPDRAVRLEADNVASCSAIAGKLDGDNLGTDA